jgi:UDP-N-acetylmuramoyl-tripeptide--D-alanyl-D-alanine ligase
MNKLNGSYLATLLHYENPQQFSSISISDITIDSRKVNSSSLFIAHKGAIHDGHDFILDVVRKGAPLILASSFQKDKVESMVKGSLTKVIFVEDPIKALQLMAKHHIANNSQVKKIGITGSTGKTTTKEMIGSILSSVAHTAKTPGNLNSEIGLPISAFTIDENSKFSVFEMGIDHVGEMGTMIDIYAPEISLITNIGYSHVGKLKSMRTIAQEKGQIFHQGVEFALMEESSSFFSYIAKNQKIPLIPFGLNSTALVSSIESLGLNGWRFLYNGKRVELNGVGRHTLIDALGAIKIAQMLEIDDKAIIEGLSEFRPLVGHSSVRQGKVTIIEDWYNSSPDSTSTIIDCMSKVSCNGHKRAVLGSMKEMGSYTNRAHTYVSKQLKQSSIENIYLFGEEMFTTYKELKPYRSNKNLFITDDYHELQKRVVEDTRKGDLVLLKGSRAMEIERLVPAISTID